MYSYTYIRTYNSRSSSCQTNKLVLFNIKKKKKTSFTCSTASHPYTGKVCLRELLLMCCVVFYYAFTCFPTLLLWKCVCVSTYCVTCLISQAHKLYLVVVFIIFKHFCCLVCSCFYIYVRVLVSLRLFLLPSCLL